MRRILSRPETLLLAACLALLAVALWGPAMSQPAHFHDFADQRALAGLPHAMNVLSNLPFALVGLAGFWGLWRLPPRALGNVQRAMAILSLAGLVLVAVASSWYHLHPDHVGLAIDRLAMAVAFAGLLGLAAATRVSERGGAALGLAVLLLGPLAIQHWATTADVLPWAVVQFGGVALLAGFAMLRPRHGALDVRWGWVLAAYAMAKLLETNDDAIYRLTGELVSGHTLKHVVAALAAVPVVAAVGAMGDARQNAVATGRTA